MFKLWKLRSFLTYAYMNTTIYQQPCKWTKKSKGQTKTEVSSALRVGLVPAFEFDNREVPFD